MAIGGGEEREGSVERQEEGTSSKRRKSVEEYGSDDSDRGGKNIQGWRQREIGERRTNLLGVNIS